VSEKTETNNRHLPIQVEEFPQERKNGAKRLDGLL
jgi:hypothetical protein